MFRVSRLGRKGTLSPVCLPRPSPSRGGGGGGGGWGGRSQDSRRGGTGKRRLPRTRPRAGRPAGRSAGNVGRKKPSRCAASGMRTGGLRDRKGDYIIDIIDYISDIIDYISDIIDYISDHKRDWNGH